MPRPKKLKDKDATELDWFMLEQFGKMLFGPRHQVARPAVKLKKHLLKQMP